MRRFLLALAIVAFSGITMSTGVLAQGWQKFVAADRSFSFHYPAGWRVNAEESVVEVTNPAKDEQLLIVAVPFDGQKSPRELADVMIAAFSHDMPDLQASGWRAEGNDVSFQVTYTQKGARYAGDGLVVKGDRSAHWFSYSAPQSGYGRKEALGLLQAVIGSVAQGAGSLPPAAAPPAAAPAGTPRSVDEPSEAPAGADRISANAHAVLWVMEFALGAPLTVDQEQAVVGKLRAVWNGKPEAEVAAFDTYPQLLLKILGLGQQDVEQTRRTLASTFAGWFQASQSVDPVVVALRAAFTEKPRVVVPGTPALTETMATAYAELMTYARLLQVNASATPQQVSVLAVRELRRRLIDQWSSLSAEDRERVTTVPGVWICSRTLIQYGSAADRQGTRERLARLAPPRDEARAPASGASGTAPSMVAHTALLQMNQMTFNSYMWSRGYKTTPFGF